MGGTHGISPFRIAQKEIRHQEVSTAKCSNCDKELDISSSTLLLFCSEKCAEQYYLDFNDFIMSLDAEIPDALLGDTQGETHNNRSVVQ